MIQGVAIASMLGKTVMTETCSAMLCKLSGICSHPCYQNELLELDLESKLKVIDALMQQLDANNKELSIAVAITTLHEIVNKIHKTLEKVHDELNYHETRWFSGWRTPYIYYEVEELKTDSVILDKRLQTLMLVMRVSQPKIKVQ